MQIINLAVLAVTLATVGALPWTQDASGAWVANNAWRDDLNLGYGALCAYSTDANGGMFHGCKCSRSGELKTRKPF